MKKLALIFTLFSLLALTIISCSSSIESNPKELEGILTQYIEDLESVKQDYLNSIKVEFKGKDVFITYRYTANYIVGDKTDDQLADRQALLLILRAKIFLADKGEEFNSITVIRNQGEFDVYGNEGGNVAHLVTLKSSTFEKIDFKNFNPDNLKIVADEYKSAY